MKLSGCPANRRYKKGQCFPGGDSNMKGTGMLGVSRRGAISLRSHFRLLVVGLFSIKGRRSALYRELGKQPGGMDGRGLGRDEKKPRTLLSRLSPPSRILNPTLQHSLSGFREKNRLHAV